MRNIFWPQYLWESYLRKDYLWTVYLWKGYLRKGNRMEKTELGRKVCYYTGSMESFQKLLIWPMGKHEETEMKHMFDSLSPVLKKQNCLFAAWQVEDWNRELSPWEAPAAFGNGDFSGQGAQSLNWLTQVCIPHFQKCFAEKSSAEEGSTEKSLTKNQEGIPVFLGGYSLAGLFALWALHETDLLSGAASCSGSLWYPSFLEYVKKKEAESEREKGRSVYLSLGTKEAKSRNPVLSTIKKCTEELYDFYQNRPDFHAILEWNPGNHFTEPMERLLKGFRWLIEGS